MTVQILQGDALSVLRGLPSESVQCVVTSPPYLGLRSYGTAPQVWGGDPGHEHAFSGGQQSSFEIGSFRSPTNGYEGEKYKPAKAIASSAFCPCGAWRGELGSESTPAAFIEHLVTIFDEVWRVLRKDGLVFCNIGDSYAGSGKGATGHNGIGDQGQRQGFTGYGKQHQVGRENGVIPTQTSQKAPPGVKPKSLLLIPQRFAIAMQERGWIVRSEIVWAKTSAMPESVRDRPTSAWEPIWMFAKSARYYFDQDAVRQPHAKLWGANNGGTMAHIDHESAESGQVHQGQNHCGPYPLPNPAGANLRNVWEIPLSDFWKLGPEPSKLQHYAAFPTEIVRRCVLASTSERGACPDCGAPWTRLVERSGEARQKFYSGAGQHGSDNRRMMRNGQFHASSETLGWQPSCPCPPAEPRPCVVLDCFGGSGTTGLVADQLGRDAILIELSPTYAEMARARIANDAPMLTRDAVTVQLPEQVEMFGEAAG